MFAAVIKAKGAAGTTVVVLLLRSPHCSIS